MISSSRSRNPRIIFIEPVQIETTSLVDRELKNAASSKSFAMKDFRSAFPLLRSFTQKLKTKCKSIFEASPGRLVQNRFMYICICKGVSEKDLIEVVKTCGPSIEQVQNSCGAATDCGACLVKLQKYLGQQTPTQDTLTSHSTKGKD